MLRTKFKTMIAFDRRFFCKNAHLPKQYVLGIETSCDETGAAVIDTENNILGECLHSQQQIHLDCGGIVPVIARRLHSINIARVVKQALQSSGMTIHDVDAIATTVKPGLKLSLTIGALYTKELMKQSGKPFIPIHHMEAHALVVRVMHEVPFPFLVLLISGGHCQLAVVQSVNDFLLLGTTLDNSPGEVLDKIARRLKLKNIPACSTMSGGRAVEFLAKTGDSSKYVFPNPLQKFVDCNFSFSSFKSRALKLIEEEEKLHGIVADSLLPNVADFCASLQHSFTMYIIKRLHRAMRYCDRQDLIPENNRKLVISGGVASNQYMRSSFSLLCNSLGYELVCPPSRLCTDNGVMIAWNGIEHLRAGTPMIHDPEQIEIQYKCSLGKDITQTVRYAELKGCKFKLNTDEVMKLMSKNVN